MLYFEISAKNGKTVNSTFEDITKQLLKIK